MSRPVRATGRDQFVVEENAPLLSNSNTSTTRPAPCCKAGIDLCLRESQRLEANKLAATRMLQMFDNPVLALREYKRFVRDLNISINVHNAVCKPHPVRPLSSEGLGLAESG